MRKGMIDMGKFTEEVSPGAFRNQLVDFLPYALDVCQMIVHKDEWITEEGKKPHRIILDAEVIKLDKRESRGRLFQLLKNFLVVFEEQLNGNESE